MAKDLAIFDPKQVQLPAYLQDDDDWGTNTQPQPTVPSLLYTGKVWTIAIGGEETKLMKRDSDGDEVPMPVLRVVILGYAPERGRAYYEGAYDPASPAAPICWSTDSRTPAPSVRNPQSKTCATCRWSVKGSKITEQGKETTACTQHRMLAVLPANRLDMKVLRLKIAVTSDYDKNEELAAKGYYAFKPYTTFLNSRGVNHTAKVVTKMRFDPGVAYPKVIFSAERWLDADEAAIVRTRIGTPEVEALLGDAYTPAGADGVPTNDEAAPVLAAPKPAASKPAAILLDDEEEEAAPPPAPKAAKAPRAAKSAAASKPEPKPAAISLDDEDEDAPAPKATKPAAAAAQVPTDVAAILADWGDE